MPATELAAQWHGWGTALKPAIEPIVLARKPLDGTVAGNVLAHGTGALNIVGTRVGTRTASTGEVISENVAMAGANYGRVETGEQTIGRWPANVLHDDSPEVVERFPQDGEESAARFFYTAKADAHDRIGSKHPTVKPVDLIRWLVRLVTPPRGTVLDMFAGSGTTGEAAFYEGCNAVLIEREEEYQNDIRRRMQLATAGPEERARESIKSKLKDKPQDAGPLFGGTPEGNGGGAAFTECSRTNNRPGRTEAVNRQAQKRIEP